jgi:outer membrane protein OmpA-like peptidoglycan-associated protein
MKKVSTTIVLFLILTTFCLGMGGQPSPDKITRSQINSAESIRGKLFNNVYVALNEANNQQAFLLAPENYRNGKRRLLEAESLYKNNENTAKVREKAEAAKSSFNKAVAVSLYGNDTFENMLDARKDAERQDIAKKFPKQWNEAEGFLISAFNLLEKGEKEKAVLEAGKAEAIYREKEYQSINDNLIGAAKRLIAEAESQNARTLTPQTLKKAKELLSSAQDALKQDRYAVDMPGVYARQAEYEARHSLQLIKTINQLKAEGQSEDLEALLLRAERPLSYIGWSYGATLYFDQGLEVPMRDILTQMNADANKIYSLEEELAVKRRESERLSLLSRELEKQLIRKTDQSQAQALQLINAYKNVSTKYSGLDNAYVNVKKIFSTQKARVYREDNKIVIRLWGLGFDEGRFSLKPADQYVLSLVVNAISGFTNPIVVIEGHSVAQGDQNINREVSRKRAVAVRSYILLNSKFDNSRIKAIGYGDRKPIAGNDYSFGRAMNERIDIVIKAF